MVIGMMIRGGFSRFAGFRCRKMTSIRHLNSYFCGASAGYCSSGIPSEHSSAAPPTPPLNKMNAISSPSQFIGRPQPIFPRMETTEELVEVFSVFVHSFNHDVSTVCGRILIEHDGADRVAFERESSNPEVLSQSSDILSLEYHGEIFCSKELVFRMHVIDPTHQLELCKANMNWGETWQDCGECHDLRLCTLVRGNQGYLVLHYSVFYSAYSAFVKLTFSSSTMSEAIEVCGSVYARYSEYDYVTDYDKKYYRSRLFDRPSLNPVQVIAADSSLALSLPLLKSVLAVPESSSLIIDVDLCVRGLGSCRTTEEFLCSKEFEMDHESPIVYQEIPGSNYRVGLCLQFYSGYSNLD